MKLLSTGILRPEAQNLIPVKPNKRAAKVLGCDKAPGGKARHPTEVGRPEETAGNGFAHGFTI